MENHYNRLFFLLSLLYLGGFLGCLFFSIAILEKCSTFTAVDYYFLSGKATQKAKRPKRADDLWNRGVRHYHLASQKIGYYPSIYEEFHNAGNCLMNQGRDEDALKAYNQALHYHPYSITDLAAGATAAARLGDYDQVVKLLDLCQRIYPFDWKIAYRLAEAYLKTGKPQQALLYFLLARKQRPKNFPLFLQVVKTYAILGNVEEARRITNQMAVKKLKPEYRKVMTSLQQALAKMKTPKRK
ncbi:MAG: tetratricopeptide repeat protein [Desulfobulbaceae bacterium]|nr:tetratricopeptide repeat protein [Desulfobulbaceae bacterium]